MFLSSSLKLIDVCRSDGRLEYQFLKKWQTNKQTDIGIGETKQNLVKTGFILLQAVQWRRLKKEPYTQTSSGFARKLCKR